MSIISKKEHEIQKAFQELLRPKTEVEKIEQIKDSLALQFLSLIESEYAKKGWNKIELAEKSNVTPSFISQLFRLTKPLSLGNIAKMFFALDILDVKIARESQIPSYFYQSFDSYSKKENKFIVPAEDFKNKKPKNKYEFEPSQKGENNYLKVA